MDLICNDANSTSQSMCLSHIFTTNYTFFLRHLLSFRNQPMAPIKKPFFFLFSLHNNLHQQYRSVHFKKILNPVTLSLLSKHVKPAAQWLQLLLFFHPPTFQTCLAVASNPHILHKAICLQSKLIFPPLPLHREVVLHPLKRGNLQGSWLGLYGFTVSKETLSPRNAVTLGAIVTNLLSTSNKFLCWSSWYQWTVFLEGG